MPETKKSYWKSLAERDALLDPSLPMPAEIPEAGIMEEGVGGMAGLMESVNDIRLDRASFLKLMGFSFAGAALAGCGKAAEKALPYLVQPEDSIPGDANYYASVCGGCSAGCGIHAKSRDGRPIKLEGNPSHPLNHGALCGMGQASVLGVYDTHRLRNPQVNGKDTDWAGFDAALGAAMQGVREKGGKLRVLSRSLLSPSLRAQIAAFLAAHPGSKHVVYDPLSASAILDAHLETHGRRALPRYRFDKADVIASFDADFLGTWISPVEFAGAYQSGRRLRGREGRFSKHFHVESGLSVTGSKADVRSTVRPSQLTLALAHLAVALGASAAWTNGQPNPVDSKHFDAMVKALKGAGDKALLVCGSNDLQAQRLANWINHELGSYGSTLELDRPSLQRQGDDAAVAGLMDELGKGEVQALIVLDADPVAELPQGKALAEAMKKVPVTVSLALGDDDTAALCAFRAPDHHWLEAWSDAEPWSGTVGLVQPAIRPLYNTRQAIESFHAWTAGSGADKKPLDLVQAFWKSKIHPNAGGGRPFGAFWDAVLLAGFVENASASEGGASFRNPKVSAVKAGGEGLELAFYPKITLQDGRHAVNPWIQETPDPVNKIAWDQVINIHPDTAKGLGLEEGEIVDLGFEGADKPLEMPVHLQPGQDPGTVSVPMGYGRAGTERFYAIGPKWLLAKSVVREGERFGVNVAPYFALPEQRVSWHRAGAVVKGSGRTVRLACTQLHQSIYTPSYMTPQAGPRIPIVQEMSLDEVRGGKDAERHEEEGGSLYKEMDFPGHRWAMAVDLSACNGCSACVVACQVENNVPVVGREEVSRAHEMHWIRIDRYYHDGEDGLETISQPMMCQQCGHAPCETVCPVDATTTSSEGLNMQTYNRCVGTRYCANNCPYKVRRFNWFDYPALSGSETLTLNPDVTVRTRGVMEKCNFCVQRVQEKKAEAKRRGDDTVKDGEIKTACQQTCPAQAITFGDINDPKSGVSGLAGDLRAFKVLADLNTKPAVSYLAQVRNKS
jgi:molybdopterin-containing oxidoreductase family iron-sulfur binding subunit